MQKFRYSPTSFTITLLNCFTYQMSLPKMHYISCQTFPQALIRFLIACDLKLKFLRLKQKDMNIQLLFIILTLFPTTLFNPLLLLDEYNFPVVLLYSWAFLASLFILDGSLKKKKKHNPPGSSVHGILQVRILEWVAISFSTGSSQPRDQTQVSHIVGIFIFLIYHFELPRKS